MEALTVDDDGAQRGEASIKFRRVIWVTWIGKT